MRTRVLALLAATAAAIVAPAAASAATTINGSFAGALFGVTSSTATIGAGSTFSSVIGAVSNTSGDLSPVPFFTSFNLTPVTATAGSNLSFSSAFGSYIGKVVSVTTGTNVVNLYALGTFTPTGSLSGYAAGASSLTFAFTQTGGANSAVSGGFTFASPPSGVPEPAAWGMLIAGAGMAGAAVRRRRSVKVTYA